MQKREWRKLKKSYRGGIPLSILSTIHVCTEQSNKSSSTRVDLNYGNLNYNIIHYRHMENKTWKEVMQPPGIANRQNWCLMTSSSPQANYPTAWAVMSAACLTHCQRDRTEGEKLREAQARWMNIKYDTTHHLDSVCSRMWIYLKFK